MEYTVENLEKAVTVFYRTEASQQAEAHQWLTEAQNSPQAWSFVWDLLHPQRSSEVQFFAATTLHTKILKYWNEVPMDHYEILKKRILESIISFAMGPKIVLNRLCIALSAYIIHTVPTYWPKAFEELVSSFQPQHLPNVEPERIIWMLLEILTVIPEEFQSTTLATSQRSRVRAVLQEVSKDILKVVEMCLMPIPNGNFEMCNLTTYLNTARCASAWIQLGGIGIDNCSRIMDLLTDLTCFVYWNRNDPEEMAAEEMEVAEVTLEALTAVVHHPNTHKYRNYIMKHTANMLGKFTKILDAERNSSDPNNDIMASIYLLLAGVADTHSKVFIENLRNRTSPECKVAEELFTCLLQCSDLPGSYPVDETSSSITFSFWYTLQDDILSWSDTAECAELLLIVKPYYRELVCVMIRKAMYDSSQKNSTWTLDDKETFRCYRQDVADTYMYCYNVLNLEMLDILTNKLDEALQKCVVNRDHWNMVESCLHAFSAVAECIEMENLFLPKLMVTLKNIPYGDMVHFKVLSGALETVGAYSEWLTDHPDMLQHVVPLVISGISNIDVSPSATMALKDLTQNCQKYLHQYADHILIASQSVLQTDQLRLPERIRLMYSVGKVLSILPIESIMQYLQIILSPSFEEIQSLVNSEPSSSITAMLVTRLKIISALFVSLHVQDKPTSGVEQPLLVLGRNTMGVYTAIGTKYCNNADVVDVLCSLLKHIVTTLMDDSKPLITDILHLVVNIYREVPQASVLGLSKTAMIMFGRDNEYSNLMQELLKETVNTTLQMCSQLNSNSQLSEKSDVLEGFFIMLAQLFKKVPHLIQNSGIDLGAVFQCALNLSDGTLDELLGMADTSKIQPFQKCLLLQFTFRLTRLFMLITMRLYSVLCLAMSEGQTVKSCCSYLSNFITQSRECDQAAVVQSYGEALVLRILISLGGSGPRAHAELLTDVLLVLNKKYCDNLTRWLHELLQQEGFPSPRVNIHQKEHFIKMVLKEKAHKKKLVESVTEFTLLCRGIVKADVL